MPDREMSMVERVYPDLLSEEEKTAMRKDAEMLWEDLQQNNLGGYSGVNRPFYILAEFKRIIEKYGNLDVGLTWSKDDLDAALKEHEGEK